MRMLHDILPHKLPCTRIHTLPCILPCTVLMFINFVDLFVGLTLLLVLCLLVPPLLSLCFFFGTPAGRLQEAEATGLFSAFYIFNSLLTFSEQELQLSKEVLKK